MPLEYVGELTGAFLNSRQLMSEEFASKFVGTVGAIVTERLTGMTDKEMKELDKDSLAEVLYSFRCFLALGTEEAEAARQIEEMQLSFAVRFLKTTYLEKRLKGVSDLRALLERAHAGAVLQRQRQKAVDARVQLQRPLTHIVGPEGQKIRPTSYLDQSLLRDFLVREKVAETLFGEGAHPEILKRAAPVLRFLCEQGAATQEIIDMVWSCQQGKHEETVRVVYGLIKEVVTDMPPELVASLFAKVAQQPPDDYSEMYVEFLKDFTVRALGADEDAS